MQAALWQDYRLVGDRLDLLRKLINAFLALLKSLVQLFIDEDVILIGVLEIGVLFLQRLKVVASALELLFKPLDTMLQLLDVLPLVVRTIVHRRS